MSTDKPIHVPRESYPQAIYPEAVEATSLDYEQEEQIQLLEYWRVIVARRWVILAVLFTIVTTTLIYTLKQTPIYQAKTTIQIDRENPNILAFKDVYEIESSTDDTLRTQFEVLKSRTLARRVVEELKLANHEEFITKDPGLFGAMLQSVQSLGTSNVSNENKNESDPLRPVIDEYLRRLNVAPVRLARLALVSFESKDPELAARIINSHARSFIEQNLQFKLDATQEASAFLDKNSGTIKANLEKSEDRLQAYSRENDILFTEDGRNTAMETLRRLEEEYTKAQADRFQKESYDLLIQDGNADSLPQFMSNPLISELTGRLTELRREEAQISVTFGPGYPLRSKITNQIDQITQAIEIQKYRILNTVRAEHEVAVGREKLLAGELTKQRGVVNKINQEIIQYNILKQEVDSNRQLHDGLLTRLKEAGVSAGLKASNIRVVDRAEIPEFPVRPRKAMNLLIATIAGLILGIGCAFAVEYSDNSVKSPEDVARYLRVPALGMVPKLESLAGKRGYGYGKAHGQTDKNNNNDERIAAKPLGIDRIAHESPLSLMSESYRSIRTSLLLSSPDHPPKTIVVTSAAPSEGKTVTAVNLAISLTQTGAKVLIIDADMRKPRVHSVFALGTKTGLSSFLAGTALLKEVIYETGVPGLLVIPCGITPPNPGELILSNRFRKMLEALREYFDYIVLDSPPVAHVSDARVLAATADSSILVIKALATSRHQAKYAMEHLLKAHARIGGVVLNDVDVRHRSYYSGYGYSGYQQYGTGQKDSAAS